MAPAKNTRASKALPVPHPSKPRCTAAPAVSPQSASTGVLRDVTHHLKTVMAVAYTASAALKHQNADGDVNAALALQRCVGDELDRQIGRIEALIAERTS